MPKSKRTVIHSFRIESSMEKRLQEEAEEKGTTANALVNRLLDRYFNVDKYVEAYGSITMGRTLFRSILRTAPPSSLEEVGKKVGQELPREFMNYWWKKVDLDAFFSYTDFLFKRSNWGSYEWSLDGTDLIMVIHHDLGSEWSVFLGHLLKEALRSCCNIVSQLDTARHMIKLQFRVPPEHLDSDRFRSAPTV